jgi:ribosomal protein S18 acetylase RimI-like enzyme
VDTRPEDPVARIPEVVVATAAEIPDIADALQDAFWDDPVLSWILKEQDSRARRLARLFGVQLRGHYVPLGTTWTNSDHAGAALWAPPGHAVTPPSTILRHLPALLQALGRHSVRAVRTLNHVERLQPKEPHWYLGVLGTRTAAQGGGVGSALLAPALERCDADGVPAYLESSKYSNIAFYRRHGFEVTGEIELPFGGPSVWPMWREPRPR